MYPKNAVSPEQVSIGPVVQISDGVVQTSGVTVRVFPAGGPEANGLGTTSYSTEGIVLYTPTQAETNHSSVILIAQKTGSIPASVTIIPTASDTAGYAGVDWNEIISRTSTVDLSNTTISDTGIAEAVWNAIQSEYLFGGSTGKSLYDAASASLKLNENFNFIFEQTIISGESVEQPYVLVDRYDLDLWHIAYRKSGALKYRQWRRDTGVLNAEFEIAASGVDPVLFYYRDQLRYLRANGPNLYWYTSSDNGQTWKAAVLIYTAGFWNL